MDHQLMKIRTLLDKLAREEIQIPELQRKYVWKRKQIRNLLDSIYKDYPTGSILLWETDVDAELRDVAVTLQEQERSSRHFLLLDGQQRLTSLLTAIRGAPIRIKKGGKIKEEFVELLFNIDHPESVKKFSGDITDDDDDELEEDVEEDTEQSFFQLKRKKFLNKPNWISITELFKDQSKIIKNLPQDSKYGERLNRITKLSKLESTYDYPVVVLPKELTYEEVTDVFVRVNSSGAKLSSSDLALAQITSRWKGSLKIFEEFGNSCYEKNYDLSVNQLIKMLVSISTGQNKFKIINTIPTDDLKSSWEVTKTAVNFTINFLKGNGQIESMKVIPTYFLLIPIVYIAKKENYELSRKQSNLLVKWFFASAMWGRYSRGAVETILDDDLSTIKNNNDHIEKMIDSVTKVRGGNLNVTPADLEGKNVKSPFFMLSYVLARQNHAKDWRTGNKVSLQSAGTEFKNEYDHVFPQAKLKPYLLKQYNDESKVNSLINDIGNMAFLEKVSNIKKSDKTPDQYFSGIPEEDLIAQNITTNPSLWTLDRYEDFLKDRRQRIADGINNLMNSLG